ncbi:TPA: hypothetical protein NBZ63_003633 [Escherichia coli]|nr:hypothetical protein [Escherichia coli]
MACAPWYVRQRLRRASGRCGSCAALVFSFAPSIRLRGLKNVIRDYKIGIVPQFGELKQSDVDLVLFYRDEYEKYFDSLKDGDECLSFKDFIECLR